MLSEARKLLTDFKGADYVFGRGCLERVGDLTASIGYKVLVVANSSDWLKTVIVRVTTALTAQGIEICGLVPGARPNTPREDVLRIKDAILGFQPEALVAIGGGSTLDAVKAANVLASLDIVQPQLEDFFGVDRVSAALRQSGRSLLPLVAVQTAAASGSHLTKYANVTDLKNAQKKLIVDQALVPVKAVFDYELTKFAPLEPTIDGVFDGIAHCLEVYYGANAKNIALIEKVALTGIELALVKTPDLYQNSENLELREAIGLATDLGGYAIMLGGTNGAHLTSFSLVDISSHGKACGIMNPYYTIFFAPAIQRQLQELTGILKRTGLVAKTSKELSGRELGTSIANGLQAFSRELYYPTRLKELPGFSGEHIKRALAAAKDPQLEMKLRNMPVPLVADLVDQYLAPLLEAAANGEFRLIRDYSP